MRISGRTLEPGTWVRITQTIRGRGTEWSTEIEGEVLSHKPEMTGSWFAHGRNDRVWLERVRLRKDDGEVTVLNLDDHTRIVVLKEPGSRPAQPAG